MEGMKNGIENKPFLERRALALFVIILNIVLLVFAILAYGRYASAYQERLREENLGNIANLNQSSAMNATVLIDSWNIKLEDIAQYISQHDMTYDEALVVIEQANSSENRQFELIGRDYTGYLARRDSNGGFIPLNYQKKAYAELQKAFDDVTDAAYDDVRFAPEFTDGDTALKYFAIYRHIPLKNRNGETESYTLMLATKASDVLAVFNSLNDFDGQSTVLIDDTGNYIVSSNDFKSTNFFQYLYVYNDLTLDQRNVVERDFAANASGELYFMNAKGQECVFRYDRMTTNNWYCVTCVPLASFRTPVFNVNYAVYAVIALFLMLVTDLAWLQHMNRRLRISVLQEKEASEAKTDFLSRMSHDIRTPLNGIVGLTTLALSEDTSPRIREYLDNIKVSGQFLAGLVNDILDLSKVESGKAELHPEPYSCRDLCKYVEAVVMPLCRNKGLSFRISPPDDAPPVLLDRLRFNQIIFNLLSNAVKYTPAGGLVEFHWERTSLADGRVALSFTVRDTGVGMSEEFQKHMFESFTQERSQTADTGSGLGLSIVNSLVKLMNGRISVESRQGEGSVFTVYLETSACEAEALAEREVESTKLDGKRVLLCEDNRINIMVAQRMLEMWGMSVDTAANGRIGVELFTASAPGTYDVILMDVIMPEMDGLEATRIIRSLDRPDAATIPIIAMTADAFAENVAQALAAGMNDHVSKPIDMPKLFGILNRYIPNTL
jgi:signal transduction histidine kinase/CheY-like chemotaxis protein